MLYVRRYLKFLCASLPNSQAPMPCTWQIAELHIIAKYRPLPLVQSYVIVPVYSWKRRIWSKCRKFFGFLVLSPISRMYEDVLFYFIPDPIGWWNYSSVTFRRVKLHSALENQSAGASGQYSGSLQLLAATAPLGRSRSLSISASIGHQCRNPRDEYISQTSHAEC